MIVIHYLKVFLPLTEKFIYNYILYTSKKFKEVYVVFHKFENEELYTLPCNVKLIQISNYESRFISRLKNFIYKSIFGYEIRYTFFKKLCKNKNQVIVHCHFGPSAIDFNQILINNKLDLKFFVSFYGYDIDFLKNTRSNYKDQIINTLKKCSGIFCEGEYMKNRVVKAFEISNSKCHVNPILINTDEYFLSEDKFVNSNKIKFLIISRFAEKKGIHIALKAFARLKELFDFEVLIVGDGEYKNILLDLVDLYNLNSQITFLGYKNSYECNKLILECDYLVQASMFSIDGDSEGGAPTVLLEAQFLETLVITTDHADIPNVISYPFYAKENNVDSLIELILYFINMDLNYKDELRKKGKEFINLNHTFKSDIYFNLLTNFISR